MHHQNNLSLPQCLRAPLTPEHNSTTNNVTAHSMQLYIIHIFHYFTSNLSEKKREHLFQSFSALFHQHLSQSSNNMNLSHLVSPPRKCFINAVKIIFLRWLQKPPLSMCLQRVISRDRCPITLRNQFLDAAKNFSHIQRSPSLKIDFQMQLYFSAVPGNNFKIFILFHQI